jgi:hypothetical protein
MSKGAQLNRNSARPFGLRFGRLQVSDAKAQVNTSLRHSRGSQWSFGVLSSEASPCDDSSQCDIDQGHSASKASG